jgi:prepilin-type N-terminal cleavage/methylation domain-containing protein
VDEVPTIQALQTARRRAFTLLEVILALAILAGALAVLGEVLRLAARQADETRNLSRAQLLAASKLAEITSGITYPAAAQGVPFESDPGWLYGIALEPAAAQGLVAVRVTVTQQQAGRVQPVEYSLVRWIRDPNDVGTGAASDE